MLFRSKLSFIKPEQITAFLKNEYPQTAAVVLSQLRPEQASRVLARLPTDFATDVVDRMLRLEGIAPEVLARLVAALDGGAA